MQDKNARMSWPPEGGQNNTQDSQGGQVSNVTKSRIRKSRKGMIQRSVNGGFQTVVRVFLGERNSATPFLPQFNSFLPQFYLLLTSFLPLFNLNLTSASSRISNHGLETTVYRLWDDLAAVCHGVSWDCRIKFMHRPPTLKVPLYGWGGADERGGAWQIPAMGGFKLYPPPPGPEKLHSDQNGVRGGGVYNISLDMGVPKPGCLQFLRGSARLRSFCLVFTHFHRQWSSNPDCTNALRSSYFQFARAAPSLLC